MILDLVRVGWKGGVEIERRQVGCWRGTCSEKSKPRMLGTLLDQGLGNFRSSEGQGDE